MHTCGWANTRNVHQGLAYSLLDENPETGQIQAKGLSGEGRRPKWRRTKPLSGKG